MTWEYVAGVPTFAPCVYFTASGQQRNASVRYTRLMDAEKAIAKLSNGEAAWVKPDEAAAVALWLHART